MSLGVFARREQASKEKLGLIENSDTHGVETLQKSVIKNLVVLTGCNQLYQLCPPSELRGIICIDQEREKER